MKVLSLFSGIGAFEKALERLGVDVELVGFSEIDKYAVKSYCAIHNVSESMNLGDITKVNAKALPRDIDLCTYGFPCQDISISGKQKGLFNEGGSLTRSGLFFEALRIIEATKPKIAIAENVKNLVSKKFNAQFQVVLASLAAAGYNNYYAVLNAKHYGVPQNRERVFIVSIRKDIDRGLFQFPVPIDLSKRLKDVLEEVVDEKYYLSGKGAEGIIRALTDGRGHKPKILTDASECSPTIDTRVGAQTHRSPYIEEPTLRQVGQLSPNGGNPQSGRIYDPDGICPTIDTCKGRNRMPKIVDDIYKSREPRVYDECSPCLRSERSGLKVAVCIGGIGEKKSNGGSQWYQQDRIYQGDIALAHSSQISGGSYRYAVGDTDNQQYRKLTPKECFRLMGFDDESFEKAKWYSREESAELLKRFPKHKGKRQFEEEERIEKMSDSQLYKQAGNSIVVDVLEAIFRQMLDENGNFTI